MSKPKFYLVIDTETANGLEQPLCYDIGYAICDSKGRISEQRSYIVDDIFLDESVEFNNSDLMGRCYYAHKIPQYTQELIINKRQHLPITAIMAEVRYLMDLYEVTAVCAYNIGFDIRALNNTIRYATCSNKRYFFPYGTQFYDIWHMACQSILNSRYYFKHALHNKWYKEKTENVLTNAESCYRYISKNHEFAESHTGLEDVKIEIQILKKCLTYGNKIDRGIKYNCWQIPQEKWKDYKRRKGVT